MAEDININVQAQPAAEAAPQEPQAPAKQLRDNRSWIKVILLSIITLGIYGLICYGNISSEINLVASKYDGKKTMNYYLLVFLIGPITCEIATIVWMHKICNRIGDEAKRRGLAVELSAKDFWLWNVLGSFIIVGPFIFMSKFFKAMNAVNADYNVNG